MLSVPITLLNECHHCLYDVDACQHAIADLLYIRFFSLLWPSWYCKGEANTHSSPFLICDLQFYVEKIIIRASNMPFSILQWADFSCLVFNDLKNSVRGESIRHIRSDHAHTCDILRLLSWIHYIRSCSNPSTTPLSFICAATRWSLFGVMILTTGSAFHATMWESEWCYLSRIRFAN